MKKSFFWDIGFMCGIAILLFTSFSCNLYTSSLGNDLARNQLKVLKNASVSTLADIAAGVESANPETAAAIMELLGNKNGELTNLNIEQKEAILNLALDTTVPISTLTNIAKPLIDDLNGNVSDDDARKIVTDMLNSVNTFDTTALTTLLSDKDAMENADPSVLANAAVATIAQVGAKLDGDVDAFIDSDKNIDFKNETTDEIVKKLLEDKDGKPLTTSEEDKDALIAAVNVVKMLQDPSNPSSNDAGVTRPDLDPQDVKLLGLFSLDDILSGFGGN